MLKSRIKNDNFYFKDHKNDFDERYHLNDRRRVIYFNNIDLEINNSLLKLNFHQILF
jgi:hypothetical protein